mgnify:CR=1 FL=1|jgi:hypothetical protein
MTDEDITLTTGLKLVLFLVWWFSGIGVGSAFMSPGIIGNQLSPNAFLAIILAFFCSALLIVTLIPAPGNQADLVDDDVSSPETPDAT